MRRVVWFAAVLAAGCGGKKESPRDGEDGARAVSSVTPPARAAGSDALPVPSDQRLDGRTADDWGRDLLDIGRADTGVRASIALHRLGEDGLRAAYAGLKSRYPRVRFNAMYALNEPAAADYPDVFLPLLVPELKAVLPDHRSYAATTISRCKYRDGAAAIRAALAEESDEDVKTRFRIALRDLGER